MRLRFLNIVISILIVHFSGAQIADFSWAVTNDGGTGKEFLAVDDDGNSYIAGSIWQLVDLDPGTGVFNVQSSGTSYNGFIQKIDKHGQLVWAKKLSGNRSVECADITIGESGHTYITGTFVGTVDFDPGPNEFNVTNSQTYGYNSFILKLDQNGNFVNVKTFGENGTASAKKIISNRNDYVYLVSYVKNNTDINPSIDTVYFVDENDRLCLMKLDSDLNFIWGKSIIGSVLNGIALDTESNIYTTGTYHIQNGNWNPADIVTAKYDSNGNLKWIYQAGGDMNRNDWGTSIAVDSNGYVYCTGIFAGTLDLDPSANVFNIPVTGIGGYFIQKLDSLGNFIWGQSYEGSTSYDISIKPNNNILITGRCSGTIDFDYGLDTSIEDCGVMNIFMHELDQDGNFIRVEIIGDETYYDRGIRVEADSKGNIYLHCAYAGFINFETTNEVFTLPPNGNFFLARLGSSVNNSVNQSNYNIALYPNPTSGSFNIIETNNSGTSVLARIIDVDFYDYSGNLLKTFSSKDVLTQVDISTFANGVYLVHVNFQDKTQVLKLVKQ